MSISSSLYTCLITRDQIGQKLLQYLKEYFWLLPVVGQTLNVATLGKRFYPASQMWDDDLKQEFSCPWESKIYQMLFGPRVLLLNILKGSLQYLQETYVPISLIGSSSLVMTEKFCSSPFTLPHPEHYSSIFSADFFLIFRLFFF